MSEVQEAGKPVEGARHQEACRVPGEPGSESKRGAGSQKVSEGPGSREASRSARYTGSQEPYGGARGASKGSVNWLKVQPETN